MKVFIAGDSTAAPKLESKRPETGWGECIHEFLPPMYDIYNIAEDGRSTKSFIDEGRLDIIESKIKKGDLLIIQFGHNDENNDDPSRYTTLSQYTANLDRFAKVAISHEAIPVFISSITRRKFVNGKLDPDAIKDYPNAMKVFAHNYGYPFIDMYKISQDILNKLGEEDSLKYYLHLKPSEYSNYPEGLDDDTHFSPYGARQFSAIIASQLLKLL